MQGGDRAPIDLGPSQGLGLALDYSRAPVEYGGQKGYYVKGDPFTVVLQDGSKLSLGNDQAASRKRMLEDLQMAKARQELSSGEIESQVKRAQLMELMGIDPASMAPGQAPGIPSQAPAVIMNATHGGQGQQAQPASSVELAGQVNAARQKFLQRRFGTPPTDHRWDEAGNAVKIPGVDKPLTEFQGKSSGFGVRAAAAHEQLNALEGGGLGGQYDAAVLNDKFSTGGPVQPGVIKRMAESVPLIGEELGTALNFTQSAAQQRVEQAQRNFVNATLRQESGAAISDGEWINAKKQYFPQPNDDPAVIEQKRLNREQVVAGFETSSGQDGRKPIAPARDSMRQRLAVEMSARQEAKAVIAKNPAARDEVIRRLKEAKISTSGL